MWVAAFVVSECGWISASRGWTTPGSETSRIWQTPLVTQVSLYHEEMGLLLVCHDAVDFHENIYVREISVENLRPRPREIRLFFVQDFNISGNDVGDTAAYDPKTHGVVHYKGARYFLAGGCTSQSEGLNQFAVGQKRISGKEGTFKDAEDGELSGSSVAQGSVDS